MSSYACKPIFLWRYRCLLLIENKFVLKKRKKPFLLCILQAIILLIQWKHTQKKVLGEIMIFFHALQLTGKQQHNCPQVQHPQYGILSSEWVSSTQWSPPPHRNDEIQSKSNAMIVISLLIHLFYVIFFLNQIKNFNTFLFFNFYKSCFDDWHLWVNEINPINKIIIIMINKKDIFQQC